jgi:predicted transposase YdaD
MSERPHKWRDRIWKKALADGALSAIDYFMPNLAADMDSSKEITAIPGIELPVIGSETDKGMRVSDIFLNVPLRGGEDRNVAVLLEQQHYDEETFPLRMLEMYVRLREKTRNKTTALAIFTGDMKEVDRFVDTCYGVELSFRYNTFYLPDKDIDTLRKDKRPFARVVLAGRLSLEAGDNIERREKYAWEILETTAAHEYDRRSTRTILDFSKGIFRLSDSEINVELKEAYQMKMLSLDEYVKQIVIDDAKEEGREEGREEGMEEGMEEKAFEVARKMLAREMPVSEIIDLTGLNEKDVLALR